MAFEPPSDFVADQGSGNKNKMWKVLGVGCLLILLLLGGLFAAGAFKMVSCCSTISDVAKLSMAGQEFGQGWVELLASRDYEEAYGKLSAEYRSRTTLEVFRARAEEHRERMEGAVPRLRDINVVSQQDDGWRWRQQFQFADSRSEQMLIVMFDVIHEDETFWVESVDYDIRERLLSTEPPARTVLDFHQLIQEGSYEIAFGRFSDGFKQETDQAAFRKFLDAEGSVLKSSRIEIKEVIYNSKDSATVMAIVENKSGVRAVVQYELKTIMPNLPAWQIETISPMVQGESSFRIGDDEQEMPVESDSADESGENDDIP